MKDADDRAVQESVFLSYPLMRQLLGSTFEGCEEHFTRTQFNILIVLYYCGERTMMHLSELIGSSKEQATRALAPLADGGLVERYIDASNRSHVHVRLTPEGENRIEDIQLRCMERLRARASDCLSTEELRVLKQCLSTAGPLLCKIASRENRVRKRDLSETP